MHAFRDRVTLRAVRRGTRFLVLKPIPELKRHFIVKLCPLIRMECFRRAKDPQDNYNEGFGNG